MTTAIIVIAIIAAMETMSFISSRKYGVRYSPMLVNLIAIIRYRKSPGKYMGYAYSQIVDEDRYFGEIKKAMVKKGVDPEYADGILKISKSMMNAE